MKEREPSEFFVFTFDVDDFIDLEDFNACVAAVAEYHRATPTICAFYEPESEEHLLFISMCRSAEEAKELYYKFLAEEDENETKISN